MAEASSPGAKAALEFLRGTPTRERQASGPEGPQVGEWYWYEERLGCVIEVGSNYAELRGVGDRRGSHWYHRVHLDEFDSQCRRENDPDGYIAKQISSHETEARKLMAEAAELTARLAGSVSEQAAASETQALAIRNTASGKAMSTYKADLIAARDKKLPELFEKVKHENELMATWMQAKLIPLEAESKKLDGLKTKISDRVLSVELYAGLVEDAKLVRKGEPAAKEEPIHIMQRRHYMDEECLVNYAAGGMEFKHIDQFDTWLSKSENFHRVFPHARCVVAFRVRRNVKEREVTDLRSFINIVLGNEEAGDKVTFLYVRNGQRLYRINTEHEFEENLFPDVERSVFSIGGGKLWGKKGFAGTKFDLKDFITDDDYRERLRKLEGVDKNEHGGWWKWREVEDYHEFTKESVYYDDMAAAIAEGIKVHNRLVLILQGLLDRSEALHPHPAWKLWTAEGFVAGLRLVYDSSRALAPAELPDFEAYRARLNASLKTGCYTVGQEDAWELHEGEKECERRDRSYRSSDYRPERYKPYGNPGPGLVAQVRSFSKAKQTCTYGWKRDRVRRTWRTTSDDVSCSFTTDVSKVLNVSAYTPGDYKRFYEDPRTRAEYLKWAPLLLAAEDWHAKKSFGPDEEDDVD